MDGHVAFRYTFGQRWIVVLNCCFVASADKVEKRPQSYAAMWLWNFFLAMSLCLMQEGGLWGHTGGAMGNRGGVYGSGRSMPRSRVEAPRNFGVPLPQRGGRSAQPAHLRPRPVVHAVPCLVGPLSEAQLAKIGLGLIGVATLGTFAWPASAAAFVPVGDGVHSDHVHAVVHEASRLDVHNIGQLVVHFTTALMVSHLGVWSALSIGEKTRGSQTASVLIVASGALFLAANAASIGAAALGMFDDPSRGVELLRYMYYVDYVGFLAPLIPLLVAYNINKQDRRAQKNQPAVAA